ncbi:MAG: sugar-binding domain-containing protein [Verrucomicrobiota bacterium]
MTLKRRLILLVVTLASFSAFAIPRPEYPRPQFERSNWINLNGEWSYTIDFSGSGFERGLVRSEGFDKKITVPFCPESKLSGVEFKDFVENLWYQRKISIPKEWDGKNILLNFGAVYYEAEIYIDGKFALRHFGGTTSFSVDITRFVKPGGQHNLVVYVHSSLRNEMQPGGKQSTRYNSHTCNYTRTTGIWQTVWLEAVAPGGLQQVQIATDIDQGHIVINPRFYSLKGGKLQVTVKDGTTVVAKSTTPVSESSPVVIPIKNAKLWSPESPFLYGVVYEVLSSSNEVVDTVISYVGMRRIHASGNKIYLNNKPLYLRMVLDQGFYPDGIWTAPTDAALKQDIELSMSCGFNGGRLHQKVFEERFHYWADKLGYLTWGESSSWGLDYNRFEAARIFTPEWVEILERDRNHPSIIAWTPNNEQNNIGFGRELQKSGEDDSAVKKFFKPEFRNRLDAVVKFNGLDKISMKKIVVKFLNELNELLAEKQIKLRSTETLVNHLVEVGFDRAMGARPLARKISELIKVPLSKKILFENISIGSTITADYSNEAVEFIVVEPIDEIALLENKTVDDNGFIVIE